MLDGECTIKIHEDFDAGLGGTLFDGSVALTNYLESLVREHGKEYFEPMTVIELGAGCGFPGLFVSKLGAKRTILTDVGDHVQLLQENIELNELTSRCVAQSLDWTNLKEVDGLKSLSPDLILCADVVCAFSCSQHLALIFSSCVLDLEELVEPLIHVFQQIATPTTQILFSLPKARMPLASEKFWSLAPQSLYIEKIPAETFVKNWKPGNKQFLNAREGVFRFRLKN